MIHAAHVIINSQDAEADRAFFRDVLDFPHVDAGDGWLIFALPGAEAAFHPAEQSAGHELYFLCEDVEAFVAAMSERGVPCTEITDQGWGLVTRMSLPGGGNLGVYQPRHPSPLAGA